MSYFRRSTKKNVTKRNFNQTINDLDFDLDSEIKQNDSQTTEIELQKIKISGIENRIVVLESKDVDLTDLQTRVANLEGIVSTLTLMT